MLNDARPYSGKPERCFSYIDLDFCQDDKTVLKNPHKGWYWHYIDNGYGRDNYRKNVVPGDHVEDFPGLHHIYLRYDWGDIEKEEGVFDWSYIDEIMDEWSKYGYRFAMRVCTYEGAGDGPESLRYATPKWVYDAGAKYLALSGGRLEPVYDDPVYLEKLEAFMKEYGRKFNADPRVDFIDIGTFGTWGEAHTGNGSGTIYPASCIKKHIALHAKYFPDKYLLLNDDTVGHRASMPESDKQEIVEFAKTLGCGARDDSVCVAYYSEHYQYDTLRSPCFYDQFWENAPVDLEFEHYSNVISNPDRFAAGLPFIEACRRAHTTYAGFHGYPRPWLEKFPYLTEYLANRLGYWYFVDGLRLTDFMEGADNCFSIFFENRGFAHAYHRFALRIRMKNRETGETFVFDTEADNRRWEPGEISEEPIRLRTRAMPAGQYEMRMQLSEGDTLIRIGMAEERLEDGWYLLSDVTIKPVQ